MEELKPLRKNSEVSRFHVDPRDCRSTQRCCEISIGLKERIHAICLFLSL